jgi:hypothetical protein
MTAPSVLNRRAVIYPTSPTSPRDTVSINLKDIGVARSQSIGLARPQATGVTRTQPGEFRSETNAIDSGKPKSPITHPLFQKFASIWEDPALQAYVRPATDVAIPPRVR